MERYRSCNSANQAETPGRPRGRSATTITRSAATQMAVVPHMARSRYPKAFHSASCRHPPTVGMGQPIPSPALMDQIGQRFRRAVDTYTQATTFRWCGSVRANARWM